MDDQTIDKIGRRVVNLSLADHLLSWDKKQATHVTRRIVPASGLPFGEDPRYEIVPNPDGRICQTDPSHGMLQIHASGAHLMCCATRPTPCAYMEPVSR